MIINHSGHYWQELYSQDNCSKIQTSRVVVITDCTYCAITNDKDDIINVPLTSLCQLRLFGHLCTYLIGRKKSISDTNCIAYYKENFYENKTL